MASPKFKSKDFQRMEEFSITFPLRPSNYDDDAASFASQSTTETIDNNPGAGRTIDTYFYQPVGRAIEKFAAKLRGPQDRKAIEWKSDHSAYIKGYHRRGNVDDDSASISTVSTNATMDDIPGPGRTIDMKFYQPVGRAIEKFALKFGMRFNIAHPSPVQILRYLTGLEPGIFTMNSTDDDKFNALNKFSEYFPTSYRGVTSLVKQSQ